MDQKVVIILPGWCHTAKNWEAFSEAFKEFKIDFKIYDFVEFTDKTQQPKSTVTAVATYVNENLKYNYLGKDIIIIGHSFGGRVAIELCKLNQLNIAKLVLLGSPNIYRPDISVKLKKVVSKFLKPILNFLPESLKLIFRSNDYQNAKNSALQGLFINTITFDQTNILRDLDQNCLLIWGEQDKQVPVRIANEMHTLIKNSQLEIIKNAGHDLPTDNPQLLAGIIANYVKSS